MSTAVNTDRRSLSVRLLTPEGAIFDDVAYMVIAPSVMGEVGLLPRHAPLIAFLRMGETRITLMDDSKRIFVTTEGYVSIEDDHVLVMVEQAEEIGEIDRARADASLQRADEQIASAGDDEVAMTAAVARKKRAENRLRSVDRAAGK